MPICTRPTGFFRRSAPGVEAIPVTPILSPSACELADAVGERQRDLRADGALRLDQGRWNIHKPYLQIVAVAHDAAEKIHRTARHVRQPLREQASRAAFSHCDGGAIFGQDAPDDFFERFPVRRANDVRPAPASCDPQFHRATCPLSTHRPTRYSGEVEFPEAMQGSLSRCSDTARREEKRVSPLPIPAGR